MINVPIFNVSNCSSSVSDCTAEAKYSRTNKPNFTWTLSRYTDFSPPMEVTTQYPDKYFILRAISFNAAQIIGNNLPVQYKRLNRKTGIEQILDYPTGSITGYFDKNGIKSALPIRLKLHNVYLKFQNKWGEPKEFWRKYDISGGRYYIETETNNFSEPIESNTPFYSSDSSVISFNNNFDKLVFTFSKDSNNNNLDVYIAGDTYATIELGNHSTWWDELNLGGSVAQYFNQYTKAGITLGKINYDSNDIETNGIVWHLKGKANPYTEIDVTKKPNLNIGARTDLTSGLDVGGKKDRQNPGEFDYEENISPDVNGVKKDYLYYITYDGIEGNQIIKAPTITGGNNKLHLGSFSNAKDFKDGKIKFQIRVKNSNNDFNINDYNYNSSDKTYEYKYKDYKINFITSSVDGSINEYDLPVNFNGFEEKIKRYQNSQIDLLKNESIINYITNSVLKDKREELYNKYDIILPPDQEDDFSQIEQLAYCISNDDLNALGYSISTNITKLTDDLVILNAKDFKDYADDQTKLYLYVPSANYYTESAKGQAVYQYLYIPNKQKPEGEIEQEFRLIKDCKITLTDFFKYKDEDNEKDPNTTNFHSLGKPYGEQGDDYVEYDQTDFSLYHLTHQAIIPNTVKCLFQSGASNVVYDTPDLGTGTGVKQGSLGDIGDIFYDSGTIRFKKPYTGWISYNYRLADGVAIPYTFRFYNKAVQTNYARWGDKKVAPNDGIYNMDYNVGIMICAAPANRVNFSYDFLDLDNNIVANYIVPDLVLLNYDSNNPLKCNFMIGNLKYESTQNTDGWCRCFKYKWQITRKDGDGNSFNIIIKEGFVYTKSDDDSTFEGRLDKVDKMIEGLPENVVMDLYIEPGFYFGEEKDNISATDIYTRFSVKIPKQFIKLNYNDYLLPKLIFPRPTKYANSVDMMLPTIERYGYAFPEVIAENWDKLGFRFGINLDREYEFNNQGEVINIPSKGYTIYIDDPINEPFFSRKSINKKPNLLFDLGLFITRHDNYQKDNLIVRPIIETMKDQPYYNEEIIQPRYNIDYDNEKSVNMNMRTNTLIRWEKPAVEKGDYLRYFDYDNFSFFINKYKNLSKISDNNFDNFIGERFILSFKNNQKDCYFTCIVKDDVVYWDGITYPYIDKDGKTINASYIQSNKQDNLIPFSVNELPDYPNVKLYNKKILSPEYNYPGDDGIWKIPLQDSSEIKKLGEKYFEQYKQGDHIKISYWSTIASTLTNNYAKNMKKWLETSSGIKVDNSNPILDPNIYWGSAEFLHRQGEYIISKPKRESITYHTHDHWYGYKHNYLHQFTHDELRRTIKYITHNNLKQNYWEILNRMQKYDDKTGMIDPREFFATHDYLHRYKHKQLNSKPVTHKQISNGEARDLEKRN